MKLVNGAVVVLGADDCMRLDHVLIDAVEYGWLNRHATPPRALVELADAVQRSARQYRPEPPGPAVTSGSGTGKASAERGPAGSEAEDGWLTTQAAAVQARISEGYVRRLCREHEVTAEWTAGGAWRINADSLRAWSAHRTKAEL